MFARGATVVTTLGLAWARNGAAADQGSAASASRTMAATGQAFQVRVIAVSPGLVGLPPGQYKRWTWQMRRFAIRRLGCAAVVGWGAAGGAPVTYARKACRYRMPMMAMTMPAAIRGRPSRNRA